MLPTIGSCPHDFWNISWRQAIMIQRILQLEIRMPRALVNLISTLINLIRTSYRSKATRRFKWVGLVMSLLVLASLALSFTSTAIAYVSESSEVLLYDGVLSVGPRQFTTNFSPGFHTSRYSRRNITIRSIMYTYFLTCTPLGISANNWGATRVSLAFPLLLVGIPTVLLFWLDRKRIRRDCCQSCSYELKSNTSGICPECGAAIPDELKEKLTIPPRYQ